MSPSLSVILPVFNRTHLLVHPLRSLRAAAQASPGLTWEVIVVDDGSTENVTAALAPFADLPLRLHRQSNAGLLAARLTGLSLATHDAVLFLDGDDLVASEKFVRQLPALRDADVVYGDVGRVELRAGGETGPLRVDTPLPACADPAEFYLGLQPAPHNPIFRRRYLTAAVEEAFFQPQRIYDPIAETWLYYQLSIRPARIAYAPGVWTIVGDHGGMRISRAWERQAWAALCLMRAFMTTCPATSATETARQRVGLCAFCTWRALPYAFHGFPADEFLALWRAAPPNDLSRLGGRWFQRLARVIGVTPAARLLRRIQRKPYCAVRTLSASELAALIHA